MNPSHRAFHDVELFFQPSKETGQDSSDVVYRYPTSSASLLVIVQVMPEIIGRDVLDSFPDGIQRIPDGAIIVVHRLFGATLHTLCGQECLDDGEIYILGVGFSLFNELDLLKGLLQNGFQPL